jgi:hypothetical protein
MGLIEVPKGAGFWGVILDWFEFIGNGKAFFAGEAVDSFSRNSLTV